MEAYMIDMNSDLSNAFAYVVGFTLLGVGVIWAIVEE